jgi:hypothetical protein
MTVVDTINEEYSSIVKYLSESNQPSFESDLNKHFKKVLLLSAASYFEHEIQKILIGFVASSSDNNPMLISLLKSKAISQQYHTYFDWGQKNDPDKPGKNANKFFSLFGANFKSEMIATVKANSDLDSSIQAFIELGHLRNILVHSNFAAYNFDTKTTNDIYDLYNKGKGFIDFLIERLN